MVNRSNNHYTTSDTPLAAFLITRGYSLLSIDYDQPRFEHHFASSEELTKSVNDYISGNAETEPSSYARVFRKLNRVIAKRCQWEED